VESMLPELNSQECGILLPHHSPTFYFIFPRVFVTVRTARRYSFQDFQADVADFSRQNSKDEEKGGLSAAAAEVITYRDALDFLELMS
jgi:hypothetical protein